jgi:hypothetical protein
VRDFAKQLKISTRFIAAILAVFCLFITQISLGMKSTILNAEFHKKLFEKHDIYTHTHYMASSSIKELANSLNIYSSQNSGQQLDVYMLLERYITQDMVKANLDSVREGLFMYFNGETKLLPDILLNYQDTLASEGVNINKINLSTILLYINRSDVIECLSVVRLVYYVIGRIPAFFLTLLAMTMLAVFAANKKITRTFKWAGRIFLANSVVCFAAGGGLFSYVNWFTTQNTNAVIMTVPLEREVLKSYIIDCFTPLSIILIAFAVVSVLLSCMLLYMHRLFPRRVLAKISLWGSNPSVFVRKLPRALILSGIFALLSCFIIYNILAINRDFKSNGFTSVIAKIRKPNAVTQVILAKNEAIYSVQVKVVDSINNIPLTGVQLNINGRSSSSDEWFNEAGITDDAGIAKFKLDKGTFYLSFVPASFPAEYQLPSPFFFDIKTAGTTLVTVSLNKMTDNPGIVEIQVLDADNNPAAGIEMRIDTSQTCFAEMPDRMFSVTNSEGIAVFKLNQGSYTVNFKENQFWEKHRSPSPLKVEAVPDSVSRYTVKLVKYGG